MPHPRILVKNILEVDEISNTKPMDDAICALGKSQKY